MKKSILFLILILLVNICNAQEHKEFYDNGNLKVSGVVKYDKKVGEWKSYYVSGKLESVANFEYIIGDGYGKNRISRKVHAKEFYENGNTKKRGTYLNDKKTGEWKTYYKSGELEKIEKYKNGNRNDEEKHYYKSGQLKLFLKFENGKPIGETKLYHENGQLWIAGKFKNGKKNGEWYLYTKKGSKTVEHYVNGEIISKMEKEEKTNLTQIETSPIFPGCENLNNSKKCFSEKVQKHLSKNFNTGLAYDLGLSPGKKKIMIFFKIDVNGKVTNINARAAHPTIKKEAIRVIKTLPTMTAGKHNGNPKITTHTVPFSFTVD